MLKMQDRPVEEYECNARELICAEIFRQIIISGKE